MWNQALAGAVRWKESRHEKDGVIRPFWSLSAAGFAATAVAFGPGRMGFGLFVAEFRSAFSMSTSTVGIVSSLGFLGFLIGLLIAPVLLARRGPETPVLAGLAAATVGMGVLALAANVPVLAAGVFLAASSAGLAWTPFNDAIHRKVKDDRRPTALSSVSTGTGVGIVLAGLAALAMVTGDLSWRVCWAVFAAASTCALVGNWISLRGIEKDPDGRPEAAWSDLADTKALPLYAVGFAYGTTSAIYIAFVADHMVEVGGLPGVPVEVTPALLYICYGLFGLAGLLTGRLKDMIGLPMLLRLLMLGGALSLALVAIAPGSWAGLVSSAGLQGIHVMMTSAVLAFWSERLFPSLPSLSFTGALLAAAGGSVLGPVLAGLASSAFGAEAMFLGTAALPTTTALLLRNRHAQDRPERTASPKSA